MNITINKIIQICIILLCIIVNGCYKKQTTIKPELNQLKEKQIYDNEYFNEEDEEEIQLVKEDENTKIYLESVFHIIP